MISSACYVTCDNCGDPAEISTEGAVVARQYAKAQGYTYEHRRDLCPRCNKKGVPAQRQAEEELQRQGEPKS